MNTQVLLDLTNRLTQALDHNYDVVDMETVTSVISALEGATITKEQLETTRLAKYINQFRRRTQSDQLARRAKNLLRKWREMLGIQQQATSTTASASNPPPTTTMTAATSAVVATTGIVLRSSRAISPPVQPSSSNRFGSSVGGDNNSIDYAGSANNFTNKISKNGNETTIHGGESWQQLPTSNSSSKNAVNKQPKQPTSFANLIAKAGGTSSSSFSQPSSHAAATTNSDVYIIDDNRSHSSESLPAVVAAAMTHRKAAGGVSSSVVDRQSSPLAPITLDSSISPPFPSFGTPHHVPKQQQQQQQRSTSASKVSTAAGGGGSRSRSHTILKNGSIELHDSNSSCSGIRLDSLSAAATGKQASSSSPSPIIVNLTATSITPEKSSTESSRFEHRKSKKHKKEKKRNKLATSASGRIIGDKVLSSAADYSGSLDVAGAAGVSAGGGGSGFPISTVVQECLSLSNSSLSMFPSATTQCTNVGDASSAKAATIGASSTTATTDHHEKTDLTFAGKFAKTTGSSTSLRSTPPLQIGTLNLQDEVALTASGGKMKRKPLTTAATTTTEATSVVVIESRSCSPFLPIASGNNSNDSCFSSIGGLGGVGVGVNANSQHDIIDVVNQDNNSIVDELRASAQLQQQLQVQDPVAVSLVEPAVKQPKKRGRKKGSKGADSNLSSQSSASFMNSTFFDTSKLLSAASLTGSNKKVKTTKELLADIQNRKIGLTASSATSSPVLPQTQSANTLSRPPSICSDASVPSPSISDACSTNATMSTVARSTPADRIFSSSNVRQPIDNDDSSTNSSTTTSPNLPQMSADQANNANDATTTTLVVPFNTSTKIEEEISKLNALLPPVDLTKTDGDLYNDIPCTCTVREILPDEAIATATQPQDEIATNIANMLDEGGVEFISSNRDDDDDDDSSKPIISVDVVEAVAGIKPSPQIVQAAAPVIVAKPMRSIFDLDFDDDDDPLHSFVAAAKAKTHEIAVVVDEVSDSTSNSNTQEQQKIDLVVKKEEPQQLQSTVAAEIMQPPLPVFPTYEVVEDPNCLAKQHYVTEKGQITRFHVDALHNCFIPNVNGNWDHSQPKNLDDSGMHVEENLDERTPDGLYVRVVPQYNHLFMDHIPKDMTEVKFEPLTSKMRKAIKRRRNERRGFFLGVLTGSEGSDGYDTEENDGQERKTKKRQRKRRRMKSKSRKKIKSQIVVTEAAADNNNKSPSNCNIDVGITYNISGNKRSEVETEEGADDANMCTVSDSNPSLARNDNNLIINNRLSSNMTKEEAKENKFELKLEGEEVQTDDVSDIRAIGGSTEAVQKEEVAAEIKQEKEEDINVQKTNFCDVLMPAETSQIDGDEIGKNISIDLEEDIVCPPPPPQTTVTVERETIFLDEVPIATSNNDDVGLIKVDDDDDEGVAAVVNRLNNSSCKNVTENMSDEQRLNNNNLNDNNNVIIISRRSSSCSNSSLKQNQNSINLKLRQHRLEQQQREEKEKEKRKLQQQQQDDEEENDDDDEDADNAAAENGSKRRKIEKKLKKRRRKTDSDEDNVNNQRRRIKRIKIVNRNGNGGQVAKVIIKRIVSENDEDGIESIQNSSDNDDGDEEATTDHEIDDDQDDDGLDDEDDVEDDDEEEEDDEEDENENYGGFHEVVTRDMTSSTTGNKHIVLTIKKTPNKTNSPSSSSLSPSPASMQPQQKPTSNDIVATTTTAPTTTTPIVSTTTKRPRALLTDAESNHTTVVDEEDKENLILESNKLNINLNVTTTIATTTTVNNSMAVSNVNIHNHINQTTTANTTNSCSPPPPIVTAKDTNLSLLPATQTLPEIVEVKCESKEEKDRQVDDDDNVRSKCNGIESEQKQVIRPKRRRRHTRAGQNKSEQNRKLHEKLFFDYELRPDGSDRIFNYSSSTETDDEGEGDDNEICTESKSVVDHKDQRIKKEESESEESESESSTSSSDSEEEQIPIVDESLPTENNGLLRSFNYIRFPFNSSSSSRSKNTVTDPINSNSNSSDVILGNDDESSLLNNEYRTGLRKVDEDVNDEDGNSCGRTQQFKEWHEVLQVRSNGDELLTILPYVVID